MSGPVRTKDGRVFSDADLERLASVADEGLDLSRWAPRKGRPTQEAAESKPSPRIAVRIPRTLHRMVSMRAAMEGRTVSDLVHELLIAYIKTRD